MTRQLISDNKLRHMRAVAQLMYDTTLRLGHDVEEAEQMYLLGLVHDIGYIRRQSGHADEGAEILRQAGYKYVKEVADHGRLTEAPTFALELLWYCDLSVDHEGNRCTIDRRLEGIRERYGTESSQFHNAKEIADHVKRHPLQRHHVTRPRPTGKRVLVTAGPIPGYIDPIKLVTNTFHGGLAKKTAQMLRDQYGHHVDLMVWKGDPMTDADWKGRVLRVHDVHNYVHAIRMAARRYDAIVCAAAVANLIPAETLEHKFASHELKPGDPVGIPFRIAPRAVDEVKRQKTTCTLIAYKCLDADEQTLCEAAKTVLAESHADVVFANTPTEAKKRKLALFKDGAVIECDFDTHVSIINETILERHYRTDVQGDGFAIEAIPKIDHAIQQAKLIETTMGGHGSVAIPVRLPDWPNAFVTTSRGHKGAPVVVLDVDDGERVIHATDKATLNAPALMAAIKAYRDTHPNDHEFFVMHRHFDDKRYHGLSRRLGPRIKRMPHVSPGTLEETEAVFQAFLDPETQCVEMRAHGAIYIRHMLPIDWTRYHDIYPSKYFQEAPVVEWAIDETLQRLNEDPKKAMTLEIGVNGDTPCRFALDTSVPAQNAENITWNDIYDLDDDALDVTIMRNCANYLTERQLCHAFRVSKHVIANSFEKAPEEKLSTRDHECATSFPGTVTHSLLLDSDDIMRHEFRDTDTQMLKSLGAKIVTYGHNSILIVK